MQISKKKINPKLQIKIEEMFAQVIADIKTKEQALIFIKDFLTETERVALSKRLALTLYLDRKKSYEEIKKEIGISSATIASVQNCLEKKEEGFIMALNLMKANQWAEKWTDKVSNLFGKRKK